MNMRFLETFVWLAKLRNFRLTAEKLHTTQAAVSSRIATLEQELGVRLFERGDRAVTLTLDGSKALAFADRLVRTMHEMKGSLKDRSRYTGVIRIGVIESIIHAWFPQLMSRIHRAWPELEVELSGDTTIKLIEQFGKGHLDLILHTDHVLGADVQNLALCDFPMSWVGATSLNLHGELLTLQDVANFPVLSFSRHSGPHRFLERLFDDRAAGDVHINCMTSVSAMVRLVADGFGLALLPPAIIQRELAQGELQILKIDTHMPAMPLVGTLRCGPETPLVQEIALEAQQAAQDFAGDLPAHVARLPSATAAADPWSIPVRTG